MQKYTTFFCQGPKSNACNIWLIQQNFWPNEVSAWTLVSLLAVSQRPPCRQQGDSSQRATGTVGIVGALGAGCDGAGRFAGTIDPRQDAGNERERESRNLWRIVYSYLIYIVFSMKKCFHFYIVISIKNTLSGTCLFFLDKREVNLYENASQVVDFFQFKA